MDELTYIASIFGEQDLHTFANVISYSYKAYNIVLQALLRCDNVHVENFILQLHSVDSSLSFDCFLFALIRLFNDGRYVLFVRVYERLLKCEIIGMETQSTSDISEIYLIRYDGRTFVHFLYFLRDKYEQALSMQSSLEQKTSVSSVRRLTSQQTTRYRSIYSGIKQEYLLQHRNHLS